MKNIVSIFSVAIFKAVKQYTKAEPEKLKTRVTYAIGAASILQRQQQINLTIGYFSFL
jgi:hypothetical protein